MSKKTLTPDVVVRCEYSGNRANAFDSDGKKWTSHITVGARQKAADGDYLLGKFTNKSGKTYWKRWDGEIASPVENSSEVEIPTDHAEVLNFIHSSYGLKPKALMM